VVGGVTRSEKVNEIDCHNSVVDDSGGMSYSVIGLYVAKALAGVSFSQIHRCGGIHHRSENRCGGITGQTFELWWDHKVR